MRGRRTYSVRRIVPLPSHGSPRGPDGRGVLDDGRLSRAELTDGTLDKVPAGLTALGVVVLAISVAWAAARGHRHRHRHPTVHPAGKDAPAAGPGGPGHVGSGTPPEPPPNS
ncbi:hypothetical protein OG204_12890 [Streptomyces sp. NBC_01387]|uniref:hypothetical protein n=1 Tax=unclassified Streptomyces TaxID=2593676 RepID=UPI0020256CF6|nr:MULTISPECIES: hypothetical protein [unclassified Streptomyces]WSC22287.1 hypothetical protein OIE60_22825 [Streptomyces sp. NBC_01766]